MQQPPYFYHGPTQPTFECVPPTPLRASSYSALQRRFASRLRLSRAEQLTFGQAARKEYYMPPPPQPPLLPHQRLIRWYRRKKRSTKLALGCGTLIAILTLCTCVASAAAGGAASQTASTPGIAQTQTSTQAVIVAATSTLPSPPPTPTPAARKIVPTPTPKPTAIAVKPTPAPTHVTVKPTPTPKPTGVGGNPWGYNFSSGNLIYNPPSNFCSYFKCITSFWGADDPGDGYVIECQDGTYSQSGGESGACSHHGGEMRPLYSH